MLTTAPNRTTSLQIPRFRDCRLASAECVLICTIGCLALAQWQSPIIALRTARTNIDLATAMWSNRPTQIMRSLARTDWCTQSIETRAHTPSCAQSALFFNYAAAAANVAIHRIASICVDMHLCSPVVYVAHASRWQNIYVCASTALHIHRWGIALRR